MFDFIGQKLLIITIFGLLATQLPINAQILPTTNNTKHPQEQKKTTPSSTQDRQIDFTGTGRPGQQTAGENRGNCPNVNNSLTALIPLSNAGMTVATHPNFWVYIPYNNKQVKNAEFVLQTEAREDIWRSSVSIGERPGYLNVALPKTIDPLKIGNWYRWYVKVYCTSSTVDVPKFVQGWISRVPMKSDLHLALQANSPQKYSIYAEHGIWYDAIDRLLRSYQQEPQNSVVRKDWSELLAAKGVNLNLPSINSRFAKLIN
jgi:hypothetical protein